ncbi:MAG: DNA cytosine methyltransferase [Clostridia bacterium]|nr:DNA cytosine methyltransferase [Clostridia bacterium]
MNVIDLFAGCGGLSLGFEMAGFNIPLAIEKDEWASETYKFNHKNTKVVTEDIREIVDPKKLLDKDIQIDGIIGGPPCQGFSLSGDRDPKDPRNSLFMEFVRFVKIFQPKFFVMENVTGILSMETKEGKLVKNVIIDEYKKIGYNLDIKVLNAAEYGVPQSRMRVFFVGMRNDIKFIPEKLAPDPLLFGDNQITIEQAIMDLPRIEASESGDGKEYYTPPQNDYQKWVRGENEKIENHTAMRHTKRLIERFEQIKYGQSVADVDENYQQRKRGDASKISGKVYSQNNMRPYPNKPSPTIPASFQSNFIHPFYNRNYTAREGARLQSFPDSYFFCGKRTTMSWEKNLSQYQQIGNAVPPLLSKAIADNLNNYLKKEQE